MVELYVIMAVIVAVAAIILYRRKKAKKEEAKVPQGLQIFNASGDLILDYTEGTYQIYGVRKTVGGQSGSVSDSKITSDTFIVPYCFRYVTPATEGTTDYTQAIGVAILPNFVISSGKISWSYAAKHNNKDAYVEMYFLYGGETK